MCRTQLVVGPQTADHKEPIWGRDAVTFPPPLNFHENSGANGRKAQSNIGRFGRVGKAKRIDASPTPWADGGRHRR